MDLNEWNLIRSFIITSHYMDHLNCCTGIE